MFPFTESIYNFRTDVQDDEFSTDTESGQTTANVTLIKELYEDDTGTIEILSSISTDTPAFSSYNSTTRQVLISGLDDDTTRALTVSYDVDALDWIDAADTFLDITPFIWYCLIVCLMGGGIISLFV